MTTTPLYKLSASEVAELTRSGKLTVEDYAKALIARVQERDPVVHGWVHFDPEFILAAARKLDAVPADKRGPLHGVAVGVKDVFYTKGMPTQHFSPIFKGDQPEVDAAVVAALRAQGALIFGKTHTTEFASTSIGPPTCNPHDPTRTAGGSSSGSGAVVGDFQVPLSIGTQTGGSTIRPGSFNGIYAFKPTWNAISREGFKIYSLTCDTVGLYARSVDDLDLLCNTLQLQDDVPPSPEPLSLSGAKFAFAKTHVWPKAQESMRAVWEQAKELLAAAGATVEEVELPAEFASVSDLHGKVLHMEGHSAFYPVWLTDADKLNPNIAAQVTNEKKVTRAQQLEAYDRIAALRPVIDEIAGKYDAIVTPSVIGEAPVMVEPDRLTGDASFCSMWTVLHTPVVNVPGFVGPSGMPIGLSLVGARYHEQALMKAVRAVTPVFAQAGWKLDKE